MFLLNGSHLGGVGNQQAELNLACSTNIDGGHADAGMIVYLPCTGGIIAVKAVRSPPALHLLWTGVGGGPPVVAGGLVWTIAQSGKLYGLDPATGTVRQQATIGMPANHFPTPGIGAGLMLAPSARNVIAFRATAAVGAGQGAGATGLVTPAGPATSGRMIAAVVLACLVAAGVSGWFIWFIRRQRRT